jgi:hypothetical protein
VNLSPTEADFTMTIPFGPGGGKVAFGFDLKFGKQEPDSPEDIVLRAAAGAAAKPIEEYSEEQIKAISHSLFEQWGADS